MKRIISFLMVIAIFMSLLPIGTIVAFADGVANATLVVESVSAAANSYVDVTIEITENPGIASMGLTLTFDEDLTLVGATNGAAFSELTMTPPAQLKKQGSVVGSCRFAWLGNDNCTELGTILTLRFQVSSGAVLYKDCPISISCDAGDILDNSRNPIELTAVSGKVTVIDYVPGDVDDSGYINMLDVLTLCQYYVDGCKYDPNGYGVNIIPESGDVDANGKINMLDALTICQYYVDDCKYDPNGYGVKLLPGKRACNHTMQHFDAKAVSCTEDGSLEYWYCSLCKDYFADAVGTDIITYDYTVIKSEGHNYIAYEAEPAGPDKNGYTAGVWCDKCEIWTSGHEYIPPIEPNESNISYRHYVKKETITGDVEIVNDNYLSTQAQINNPNPITYKEGTGIAELIESVSIEGKQVTANGYSFLGWYEKPELTANRVYSISPDATGDRILYGIWTKDVYTITYLPDSATSILPKIEDGSYTVDKETALEAPPSWPNMVWVGWSDENGRIVKSIPKGTTGNITLTANWMSRRSQTVPNTDYASDTPAITIDAEKGIYAFTYEIGDIQNVPIQQIEEGADGGKGFNLVKGAIHEISTTYTQKITEGEAVNVANTIANATTKSDSWTLSEDWSKSTTFSQEHSSEVSQEQSQTAAIAFSESESKLVMWNCAIGALPTPTREGCTFLGWYREDGTAVTENTVFTDLTDITVKAYWQSGWVLASELPENAQVTDRKWRYTKTETTESTSSSMTGWTQTGNYWKKTGSGSTNYASFPSGFDTGNWYYQNFAKSAYSAYDNGSTKREVSNTWAGYIYWHWMYNVSYANTTVRTISHRYGSWDKYGNSGGNMYQYFFATASSVNCPYLDNNYCCSQNLPSYNCHSIISNTTNVGTPRCFRFDYYTSTYIDYQKIYQYQKVTTGESATEMVNGGQISDVHVLVKYTIK